MALRLGLTVIVAGLAAGAAGRVPAAEAGPDRPASRAAAAPRITRAEAIEIARRTPDRFAVGHHMLQTFEPVAQFDPARGLWQVAFLYEGRRVLLVEVEATSGRITAHHITDGDFLEPSMSEVIGILRSDVDLDGCLEAYALVGMRLHYSVRLQAWSAAFVFEGGRVARFRVKHGRIIWKEGPWKEPTALGERLRRAWRALRPDLSITSGMAWLYALMILGLFVDVRRLISWRTLDAVAMALFAPAWLLIGEARWIAYGLIYGVTLYLFARCLARGLRPGRVPAPVRAAAVYLVFAVLLLLHHVGAPWTDVGSGHAGLLGGQMIFRDGQMPYGHMVRKMDSYGPFHYVIHGALGEVFPIGVNWRTFDALGDLTRMDTTAVSVLAYGFHLLTVVGLLGICRRRRQSWRTALAVVTGYLLLAPSFDFLPSTSHRITPALVLMALWAWPNPWWSALLLGLGTATLWYPLFLFPLWLASFRGWAVAKFAGTYAAVGLACLVLVMVLAPSPVEGVRTMVERTLAVQEVAGDDGDTTPVARGPWRLVYPYLPAVETIRTGIMIAFLAGCVVLVIPFRKGFPRLVCLSAAVVIGTQLWKGRHMGQYVGWYAPLLVLALFAPLAGAARKRASATATPGPAIPEEPSG